MTRIQKEYIIQNEPKIITIDHINSYITSFNTNPLQVKYNLILPNHIKNLNGPEGNFGHPLLNRHMNTLDGDFIMFADDDDRYVPDAFEYIRNTVIEKKLYIFKHRNF